VGQQDPSEGELEALRAERDFASALVDIAPCLVCVLDGGGRILRFNRACEEATGWRAADVIGRDARDVVIPREEREAFGAMLRLILASGQPSPRRGSWMTRSGARRLIDWTNRPLRDASGRITHLVAAGIDVTQQEHATGALLRLAEEQAALRRMATLVAAEPAPEQIFGAVAEEAGKLVGACAAATFRFRGDVAVTVGSWSEREIIGFPVGTSVPLGGNDALTAIVARSGTTARIEDYEGVRGEAAERARAMGYRSGVAAPIVVDGVTWGGLLATSVDDPFPLDAERRLGDFAELVALAVASAQARAEVTASRARLVELGVAERRRLERNLHDGAQQRLVALALRLRMARSRLPDDAAGAEKMIDAAAEELQHALDELRELARGLHPAVLTERGLGPALESLAARAPWPVQVSGVPEQRLPPPIEAAIYFVVAEALTNAARHAAATGMDVVITTHGSAVAVTIDDDGRGSADPKGSGLRGLADRVQALGGTLSVHSPADGGTRLTAELPLDRS
jgi:PAS domain S-box-containing protein